MRYIVWLFIAHAQLIEAQENILKTLVIPYATKRFLMESNPARELDHTILRLLKMFEAQSNYKPVNYLVLATIKHAGIVIYRF